ncbi:MAG: hypothetical protein F6K22_20905 [Okeania sp. SIO2F4]|uniref:hypothetical protein n=1 Tax=Okeania sp. SIO2F4 TaxID=2607790 RepID=UPI001429ADC5|nr:hypothetical protein [Okeania sp. SIO2F4]NES05068.1 hypothetical protein [Okeania sp. SIO2F4]
MWDELVWSVLSVWSVKDSSLGSATPGGRDTLNNKQVLYQIRLNNLTINLVVSSQ